ncbi:NmrA family transcriptional regulator [Secundilactobacillus pentosiphilus]|uniref:NmrA family transcriptional regulator n=1 Tax=Secundilactobacillus pentosiphilus TaxID=1714682 RepID=A0A1Z5IPT1_9LACO|nr:SDR family oxidoreductase [Secundilactobacillus pentosiphilus]GAX03431.1 NmrA family transcriptional regulator [Secundilactobacillus pentosiphilus]
MDKILVLGSTGNIGWPIVKQLAASDDVAVVAGIYHAESVKMKQLGVETRHFDFLDASTFEPVLKGINKVFFVRPPELAKPERDMKPFLTAVRNHGIDQVVFISLIGVEKNPMVPHRKIERMITEMGLPHTFIRPSFFMQNLTSTHLQDIQQNHDLFVPAGRSKTSFIDTRDIAAVAVAVMQDPKYLGQALEITGPEAITYQQAAGIMTKELGVQITYSKPSLLKFRHTMIQRGIKKGFVNVMVMLYLITQLGNAKTVNHTVEKVLHRPATSFAEFVRDNRQLFLNLK